MKRRTRPAVTEGGMRLTAMTMFCLSAFPTLAEQTLPEVTVQETRPAPLAYSATSLGLPASEIPATIEVVDQAVMTGRGYHSVTEVAQGIVGMTAGDFPAEPAAFSMRGFTNSQINTLYNGIKIGPQNMTSRVMDTGNLEQVEVLKGPASLMSGEGASGGAINFVTKRPHSGPVENEAYMSSGAFNTVRAGVGSGGSTPIAGLDYRFDLIRSSSNGFVDDTGSRNWHLSTALDYRVDSGLLLFSAFEYKKDSAHPYWGTPLVSATAAGGNALGGIVSGSHVSNYNGTQLGAVAIDGRTLRTNYNVTDNRNNGEEYWLRGGLEWKHRSGVSLKEQFYYYTAKREWFNNEVIAFNATTGLVDRERFYVAHDQEIIGSKTELQWDAKLAGMENRLAATFDVSKLDFVRPGAANFPGDSVALVNPERGTYGALTTQQQTSRIGNIALAVEDRLKVTQTLSLVGGLRHETIDLDRTSVRANGDSRPGFPYSKSWHPTTGRAGLTWEAQPGTTFYAQYATGADVAANNIFLLGALQPLELSHSRTYEAGLRQRLNRHAQWSLAVFDIERSNVYAAQGGQSLKLAGKQRSNGVELALAMRPGGQTTLWGNVAYTRARYSDYDFAGGSFSGNTPPNVPRIVANAGASYRLQTTRPIELGLSVRHVGDRYNTDANTVKLRAYTVTDAYAALDVDKAKFTFRIRNLANRKYAVWGDPFYPDQILLGAPRSAEIAMLIRF
jgi:iron complex outermembrane receptor protein